MLNIAFQNKLEPKSGRILLAEPFMQDEYFQRSVILLCEAGEEGAFGFILNSETTFTVEELNSDFQLPDIKLSLGGPVGTDQLYFLHNLGDQLEGSIQVLKDVWIGGNFDELGKLAASTPEILENVKFYLGYAGWASQQLEDEIKEGTWKVIDNVDGERLLAPNTENLWQELMEELGGKYGLLSKFPVDPSLN